MYLIPEPKKIIEKNETYLLPYHGSITMANSCTDKIYNYAQLLKNDILENVGFSYTLAKVGKGGTIYLLQEEELSAESYLLEIGNGGIRIKGGDERGLLYGIQTLRQIFRQKGACIPCVIIEDSPSFMTRGFFHDVTRGRVPTLAWLKTLADTLSYYKINQMQLYIEHSFLFAGLSEMWRDDTPLCAEEIMELDRYCAQIGIELVPSLSTFGHLYKMLNTKTYRQLCELEDAGEATFSFIERMAHHTIDISNTESFLLIRRLIGEYMPLFTSKKFNICADETFDLGRGRNKERAGKEGVSALYMEYVGKLCDLIVQKGRMPMLWGDVMLSFPEFAKELPEETVCLNWGYAHDQSEDSTRIYAQNGVRQYTCPGVLGWNQLVNLQQNSYKNISRMCGYAMKYKAEGIINTDWGDFGHINHPAFSIPGAIYGAAASWNGELPSYEEINKRISILEYKDSSGRLMAIVGTLSEQESFGWWDAVYFKETGSKLEGKLRADALIKAKEQCVGMEEKNREIDRCIEQLCTCTGMMDSSTRNRISPYLLAAEGMKLFNRIGKVMVQSELGETVEEDVFRIAVELEEWYYRYRLLWYTVSKESELYRISEVIFWYADYLRNLKVAIYG